MSNRDDSCDRRADHLADVEDGAGCAEIWERMNEVRERADDGTADADARTT